MSHWSTQPHAQLVNLTYASPAQGHSSWDPWSGVPCPRWCRPCSWSRSSGHWCPSPGSEWSCAASGSRHSSSQCWTGAHRCLSSVGNLYRRGFESQWLKLSQDRWIKNTHLWICFTKNSFEVLSFLTHQRCLQKSSQFNGSNNFKWAH